jgi:hypothetical protein
MCLLAVGLLVLPGCIRTKTEVEFAADNTGTFKQASSIKTEAIDSIREQMELGGGNPEQLNKILDQANEKKMAQELKDVGVEITSSKSNDEGGWKGGEVAGTIKDVNEFVKKTLEKSKKAASESGNEAGGMGDLNPRFLKTSTEGVARLQIMAPFSKGFAGMSPDDIENLTDEQIDIYQAQMDMVADMFSLADVSMEIHVTVPGKITETKGCKKLTENKVAFQLKGSDINVAGARTMFGMKDGVSVDFTIPEGMKITLEDPAASKPVKATEDEAEPEKSKGGLKIK